MNVQTVLKKKLGETISKMYLDSACFFLANIETECKRGFFVESSQFEDSDGNHPFPRKYNLKFIGERVSKIKEFESKYRAMKFWDSIEFTKHGDLVLDRFNCSRECFDKRLLDHYRVNEKLYDNGFTAFYTFDLLKRAISYCEGSTVEYFCPNGCNNIKNDFMYFYNENEA